MAEPTVGRVIFQVPGDFNADGLVDAADFVKWRENFGQNEESLLGAGDGSGTVDLGDYDIWAAAYASAPGSQSNPAVAVPEPTGLLLAVGFATLAAPPRSRSSKNRFFSTPLA